MVKLTARGFNLIEKDKSIVDKELNRVKKMLPKVASFDVTISKKVNGYNCDVMIKDAGSFIKGEALADSIESAVNSAVDVLKRRIRKLKTYVVDKKRKQGISSMDISAVNFEGEDSDIVSEDRIEIVKFKKVLLQMMDDEEAVIQMEMLGHSYFVYIGDDGNTRVVYRRNKGYGVLICDR